MVMIFIGLILGVNIIAIVSYAQSYKTMLYTHWVELQESVSEDLVELVDAKLDNQAQITISISHNERIREILSEKPDTILSHISNEEGLKEIFLDYAGSLKYIYSVNFFSKNYFEPLNSVAITRYSEDVAPYAINPYQTFEKYVSPDALYRYRSAVYFHVFRDASIGQPILMSLKWITDSYGEQTDVAALLMSFDHAFSSIADFGNNSDANYYLIDTAGESIFSAGSDLENDLLNRQGFLDVVFGNRKSFKPVTFLFQDEIVTVHYLENIDWVLVESTPSSVWLSEYRNQMNGTILLNGTLTLAVIALVIALSKWMLRGLEMLTKNIRRVKKGELELEQASSNVREIYEINNNFNRMTNQIRTLLQEIEESNKREKEAELNALQAQINPHFLYNTLDALYWMSNDDQVCEIITALGKFYRLSLSKGMDLVTTKDEIDQVMNYMDIQMRIYEDSFTVKTRIDPEIYRYKILKLILQPMVENAILHGFEQMNGTGEIIISAQVEQDNILLEVLDNGCGIDPAVMKEILDGKRKESGYGIRNVHERIKLKFGDAYGLTYHNRAEGGTSVQILLPKVE